MKVILTILLLCSIIFHTVNAKEGDWWLDMTIASIHDRDYWQDGDTREDFNEKHFGIGIVHGLKDYLDVSMGFVRKNSYDKFSVYAFGNIKYPITVLPEVFRIEPAIALGLASGYGNTPEEDYTLGGDTLPLVLPNINLIIGDDFMVRISYLPDLRDETTSLFLFQAAFRFN